MKCAECRFWQKFEKTEEGECRRRAPSVPRDDPIESYSTAVLETLIGILQCQAQLAHLNRADIWHGWQYLNDDMELPFRNQPVFPETWPGQWCGEFEARP